VHGIIPWKRESATLFHLSIAAHDPRHLAEVIAQY